MKTVWRAALVAAIALFYVVGPAFADEQPATLCDKIDVVLAGLRNGYGEIPIFEGLTATDVPVLFAANPRTGTWTLLSRDGPDRLCYLLIGRAWQPLPFPLPPVTPQKGPSI